ncbi:hypothetical protein [Litoribacter populi]|uniref:hypothetical protein n=1 Tax=Litoribacter populi TaxID=2598460 RepID=UPI00117CEE79|nr:hypothetical protein [Litoribacter populi]
MRIFVFAAIAGAFLSACQLDNSPALDDLLPASETVSLAINLKGSEWKANKASPIGGRLVDGHTYFSYKVLCWGYHHLHRSS